MEHILVTGGLGFIGSHICVELLQLGYNIIVIDNLSNSKLDVKNKIEFITNKTFELYIFDICDINLLESVFNKHKIISIIHLAGLKSVNESIKLPLKYYNVNLISTINLLSLINKYNIERFIFSSSATVYGIPTEIPLNENSQIGLNITNPYGKTKYMLEEIIKDYSITSNCKFIILRYFNPVGAHESGLIGENPNDIPNNLMPYILRVARNQYKELTIYGNDYNTPDGTCIRDFIHVTDLAKAHVVSNTYNMNNKLDVFNIGTGKSTSVLEIVNKFSEINNIQLKYIYSNRRSGDIEANYADVTKANNILGWKAEKTLEDICRDAYNFACKNII